MKKCYFLLVALLIVSGAAAQWFPQNSGTTNNLNSVYFIDANTGYAVGDTGIILKTTNGGANWVIQNSGITANLFSVHFPKPDTGYAIGSIGDYVSGTGIILKTVNGGTLWTYQSSANWNHLNSIYFTDALTGYAVGKLGRIFKTTDGGINWTPQTSTTTDFLYSVHFPESDTGYAVGTFTILKTDNGGSLWSSLTWTTELLLLFSVYFTSPETGYVVGGDEMIPGGEQRYGVLITTNGGTNWTTNYSPFSDSTYYLNSVNFSESNKGYAVGWGGYILKTIDGGTNWIPQPSGTSLNLNSVYFPVSDTGYIVGDSGIILNTTNGGLPVGINDQILHTESLKIYPNPASTSITISTPTTPQKNTFLTIYNLNGQQLIQRQILEQQTVVDVSGLSQGVYFVKVTDDRTVMVSKFVKK